MFNGLVLKFSNSLSIKKISKPFAALAELKAGFILNVDEGFFDKVPCVLLLAGLRRSFIYVESTHIILVDKGSQFFLRWFKMETKALVDLEQNRIKDIWSSIYCSQ
jgi:hypothetical protein